MLLNPLMRDLLGFKLNRVSVSGRHQTRLACAELDEATGDDGLVPASMPTRRRDGRR
jgi:hypothetical protein